jgi:hypothetical protein
MKPSAATIKRDANKFYTLVKDWGAAVRIATSKARANGGYFDCEEGFLVCWDAKEPRVVGAPRTAA